MSGDTTKGNDEATKCRVMVRKAMGDGRLYDVQKQDNATKNGKSDGQDDVFVLFFVFSYFRRHGDDVISFLSRPLYLSLHRTPIVFFRFLHSWPTFLFACDLFLRHMAATKIIDCFFFRSFLSLPLTTLCGAPYSQRGRRPQLKRCFRLRRGKRAFFTAHGPLTTPYRPSPRNAHPASLSTHRLVAIVVRQPPILLR